MRALELALREVLDNIKAATYVHHLALLTVRVYSTALLVYERLER